MCWGTVLTLLVLEPVGECGAFWEFGVAVDLDGEGGLALAGGDVSGLFEVVE